MRRAVLLLLLSGGCDPPEGAGGGQPGGAHPPLGSAKALDAALDAPTYAPARWGVLVVDTATGATLYERNPDKLVAPASVTKLFSAAAAWCELGPDSTTTTPVYQRGRLDGGVLRGDLILVGRGDLTLGGRTDELGRTRFRDKDHTYADPVPGSVELASADPLRGLKLLAKQVRAAGIARVTGDVLVDDRLFEEARGTGSGPHVVSPVMVNDNVIDIVLTPGKLPGDPVTVAVRPETGYFRPDIRVTTGTASSKVTLTEPNGEDPHNYVLRGSIPAGAAPVTTLVGIARPAEFARTLFVECLSAAGVAVDAPKLAPVVRQSLPGRAGAAGNYLGHTPVAELKSPPLRDALKVTLKVSHNLYASTLPMLVAAKHGKTSLKDGMTLQRLALEKLGVPVAGLSFAGGAGGANADHATPRATAALLLALQKRPDWPAFADCLPILGLDGTLAEIGTPGHPAAGMVRAKTGTLYWDDLLNDRSYLVSKALAGVMTTKSGRKLTFAIFLNDLPLPKGVEPKREGRALGRLCEILWEE